MARKRYYRRYRRRPRKYIRRWFKRKTRRFINGSSKSICRLKVPQLVKTTLASVDDNGVMLSKPITPFDSGGSSGNPFSALDSPIYRQFCNLYEEVKCIGGKINLSVETPIGTATIPSVTIITAWDRRLNRQEAAAGSSDAPTYDDLITYSTAKRAVGINNSVCKIKRSLYASDLIEKAQWHDCTFTTSTTEIRDVAWYNAGNNCNFFSPGMWLGMAQSGSAAADINVIVEVNWYFAFRNPKYGGAASAGAKGDMRETAPMMDQEAIDGDDTEVLDREVEQAAPSAKRARFIS